MNMVNTTYKSPEDKIIELQQLKGKTKVKFSFFIHEEYISVTYGCYRFIDSYRFLSSTLDSLNKKLVDNSQKKFEKRNC